MNEPEQEARPLGDVEIRAAEVVAVDYPKRTIELVVMPYETPAAVAHKGRTITEIVSRGAFDGVQRRIGRMPRVNRDHNVERTIGKVLALHPSRKEGLVADLRIAQTHLGDESLSLADEGILDASAGFAVMTDKPNAEVWETRNRRRLNHLWLDHVALTPDPAYEGAKVLAVRTHEPTGRRPNLEQIDLERWQQLLADLDRRYA